MQTVFSWLKTLTVVGCLAGICSSADAVQPPRLVVVVSVDQLCQEYLQRFGHNLAKDDFFLTAQREGATYDNCHHRHAFTFTAPGHATIATGAYPNRHGIIGNSWYSREDGKTIKSIFDPNAKVIGNDGASDGVSPRLLLAPTLGDALKLSSGGTSKVFSVGLKDRAACLTAGRLADGVFWYDYQGNWVTSDFYSKKLPGYIRNLNEGGAAKAYGGRTWKLLYDKDKYTLHRPDENPHEKPGYGLTNAFPHVMPQANEKFYFNQLVATPWGTDYTLLTAQEIIRAEGLGKDNVTDLLHINFAANDYVGHHFGPFSLEVEDMTYRTDRLLGDLARFLDKQVGGGNWTIGLSADHGVSPIATYAKEIGLSANVDVLGKTTSIKNLLNSQLKDVKVLTVETNQVFLDQNATPEQLAAARVHIRNWMLKQPAVSAVMTRDELAASGGSGGRLTRMLYRANHPTRSGDVLFALAPYHHTTSSYSTTHGSPWRYDTHVPLVLLGSGVRAGNHSRATSPANLAPTLARIMKIAPPAMSEEEPLLEAIDSVRP